VPARAVTAPAAATQARGREAIARRAEAYRGPRGLEIPVAFLVGAGRKPWDANGQVVFALALIGYGVLALFGARFASRKA